MTEHSAAAIENHAANLFILWKREQMSKTTGRNADCKLAHTYVVGR